MIEGVVVRMNEERRRCGYDRMSNFYIGVQHLTFFWREIPVFRRERFHLAPYLTPETEVTHPNTSLGIIIRNISVTRLHHMSEAMEPTQLQPSRTAAASHHTNQPFLPSFGTLTVIITMSPFEGGCGFTLFPSIFNRQDDAAIGDYLSDQHRTVIVQQ